MCVDLAESGVSRNTIGGDSVFGREGITGSVVAKSCCVERMEERLD
jgi:hypothetical protein